MTDNHHLEFPLMLLGYFQLLTRGGYVKAILELYTDTLLSRSRHLTANKNFVLFHSMKALQSFKDERGNELDPAHLPFGRQNSGNVIIKAEN